MRGFSLPTPRGNDAQGNAATAAEQGRHLRIGALAEVLGPSRRQPNQRLVDEQYKETVLATMQGRSRWGLVLLGDVL